MLWHVAIRHYPTLIPILLEFVFRGSLRGIAPGCHRSGRHPFAEPEVGHSKWNSMQAMQERLRRASVALKRMVAWAQEERRQFQEGVMSLPTRDGPAAQAAPDDPAVPAGPSSDEKESWVTSVDCG